MDETTVVCTKGGSSVKGSQWIEDIWKQGETKMEAQVDTLRLLTQPKGQQQFNNKKQPELTENRTAWKTDN